MQLSFARCSHTDVQYGSHSETKEPTATDYPLQTVQNKCLRTIIGAYKTTNVQILEHEASVPPLDLHLEMLAINNVRRIEDSAGNEAVEET